MINYIADAKYSEIYKVDFDNKKFNRFTSYEGNGMPMIDYSYRIPEDGLFTVTKHDGKEESFEVKKNDLVLRLYSIGKEYYNKEYIVINDPKLKDYYDRYDEYEQERIGEEMAQCANKADNCIKEA